MLFLKLVLIQPVLPLSSCNTSFFSLVVGYPEVGIVINFNKNENAWNYYSVTFVSISTPKL